MSPIWDVVSVFIIAESIRHTKLLNIMFQSSFLDAIIQIYVKKEILPVCFSPMSHIWDDVSVLFIYGSIKMQNYLTWP